ncbi:MAG: hypothetical protein ACE5I3_03840, partial [Phycisphaerae bacterium]
MLRRRARRTPYAFRRYALVTAGLALPLWMIAGCPFFPEPGNGADGAPVFNNTTDPTNGNASYVGSAACSACHPGVAEIVGIHAHTQALKRIEAAAPNYPPEG